MSNTNQSKMTAEPIKHELFITREFDAPRELVWLAWTNPEMSMRWWGPKDFTSPVSKIDFQVGGQYLNCMESSDGKKYWGTGVYKEIIPFEKIILTDCFADENGNVVPASYYGMAGDDFPLELLVTLTFEEHDGKTKMTLIHDGLPAGEILEQTSIGWNESFDKLDEIFRKSKNEEETKVTKRNQTKFTAFPGDQEFPLTTTQKITPFLWFDGKVEEALNFYTSIFDNANILSIRRLPENAPGERGKILTAIFQLDGVEFMALDGGPQFSFTPAISFFVNCKTQEEVDELWEKLSAGGETQQCGWLKDKYGITWQVVPTILAELLYDPDPVKSKRVMNAMLQMIKLDIKGLKQAYDGL